MKESGQSFLYLHFNDVHKPYNKREPWYREKQEPLADTLAAYDSELHFVDRVLGSLYRDFGWDRNTILWIVSDHGEEFMDHGAMGHGFSLFQELTQVVGMVHAPGVEPGSVDVNVSLIDVLPTLLDWLDIESPDPRDGRSLFPLLMREPDELSKRELEERILFAHRTQRVGYAAKWAAIYASWKLIHDTESDDWMLFDLDRDPDERINQYAAHPQLVEVLRPALELFKTQEPIAGGEAVGIPLDADTLEHLRSLGYAAGGDVEGVAEGKGSGEKG